MRNAFVAALALSGLSVIGASTVAQSAAIPTSVATINSSVPSNVADVQYRRWGGGGRYWGGGGRYWGGGGRYWGRPYGWGWGGFAAGALVGAAVAAPYYYGPGYYGYYGAGRCWVATGPGRGYWVAC